MDYVVFTNTVMPYYGNWMCRGEIVDAVNLNISPVPLLIHGNESR